jgi:predicted O-methyltransferase YrrM
MSPTGIIGQRLAVLRGKLGRPLDIVEIGSIRSAVNRYRADDGWSTLTFAEHVEDHGGTLTSIDLNIDAARTVLARHGLLDLVLLVRGLSIDVLAGMVAAGDGPGVDVVYLDSDNDANLVLHEYLLASRLVRTPGLIMVDDVDLGSATVVKGHKLVPWLDRTNTPYQVVRRSGDTYTTGVLTVEV